MIIPDWLKPVLRTPENLYPYQKKAIMFQCSHLNTMLWIDMGLGKTVITLSSLSHLIQCGFLKSAVIVAPKKVIQLVWRQEALKWSHTTNLTFSMVSGTRDQRCRGLLRPANIYLVNYENLKWLSEALHTYFIKKGRELPFDGIVWDEVSKMKNSTTNRVSSVKKILSYFKWRTGLTGTPAANGYRDLHGQFLVVDGGERLGITKSSFDTMFPQKTRTDYNPQQPEPMKEFIKHHIKGLIGDITLEMSAEDYNPLPKLIENDVVLEFPEALQEKYDILEKEFFLELDKGGEIEVFNQAALMNKCLQFSQGAVYLASGSLEWEAVHSMKLEALEDIIDEANGQPVLCSYQFQSDAMRIMQKFKHLKPINLTECKSEKSTKLAMERWKNGDCPLMIGHPASMGHGIDGLQDAGNIIVWFGLTWSLDFYNQLTSRVRRQGQKKPVIMHRIIMNGTLDRVQELRLLSKDETQKGLRNAVKNYRKEKGA